MSDRISLSWNFSIPSSGLKCVVRHVVFSMTTKQAVSKYTRCSQTREPKRSITSSCFLRSAIDFVSGGRGARGEGGRKRSRPDNIDASLQFKIFGRRNASSFAIRHTT